jgi:HEAT repeat protein
MMDDRMDDRMEDRLDDQIPSLETPAEIPFQQLIEALLDVEQPFKTRYLYRLSDLEQAELDLLAQAWPMVPEWRRQALMEDVQALGERDYLLSYESLALFALTDRSPKVRLPALLVLHEYENPRLIDTFIELLKKDEDVDVRAAAASALGRFVYLGELDELPQRLFHKVEEILLAVYARHEEDDLVRRMTLEAIGFSSRDDVNALIEEAYQSGQRAWMLSAMVAMGRSANERWAAQITESLDSRLPAMRAEAARASGEVELRGARSQLVEMLDDPDDLVVMAAIWSLSQLGGAGIRKRLERLYRLAEDEETAEFIEMALDNLAFNEGADAFELLDLVDDEDLDDDEYDLDDFLEEDEDY